MKTYTPRPGDVDQQWWVVDATDQTLGRLASEIATILRGKNKPYYTPFLDTGDYVIVVNASKVRVTGRKPAQKMYYRYSGYPGGLKETNLEGMMQRNPAKVIELAVKGMLPKNRLGADLFRKLKVYNGPEHPHAAQQPKELRLRTGSQVSDNP